MDPALQELLRVRPGNQEVEAVLRLTDPAARIPGIRVVSRFGSIITCRLPVDSVVDTRALDEVASIKAARLIGPETLPVPVVLDSAPRASDVRSPSPSRYAGRVVIGLLDWGFAFASNAFRHADGRTRLLALWDQRRPDPTRPNRYGYGVIHDAARLDAALRTADPYAALRYHPAESDAGRIGAHGTVTADIAAGNGRGGSPIGLAPDADIVCVHLATEVPDMHSIQNLGDSVRVIEGLDLIRRLAAKRPFVVTASIGRHGGPHDGTTLVEAAEDTLASEPNSVVIHSAGNYASRSIHASGILHGGDSRALRIRVDRGDHTGNEIEIWYDRPSRLLARVESPDGQASPWVGLDERAELASRGRVVARVYHRGGDPQNGDNLIDIFLQSGAPSGEWTVVLRAVVVPPSGTTFHAWIERDEACTSCQAQFHIADADASVTTSTLANARRTISVGAVDGHDPARFVAPFSSAGPTRDGRTKPDCVAPGVDILAVRSPWFGEAQGRATVRRSGTSMAAPYVAGCAALVLDAGRGLLGPDEAREIVLSTTDDAGSGSDRNRYGYGHVNVERAVAAAERVARRRTISPTRSFIHLGSRRTPMPHLTNVVDPALDFAEAFVERSGSTSPDAFLQGLVAALNGAAAAPSALRLFRDTRTYAPARGTLIGGAQFTVVARPGQRFLEVRPGDVLVRRTLGEGRAVHLAVAVGPEMPHDHVRSAGLTPEDGGAGWFVQVIESGYRPHRLADGFARRSRDAVGKSPADQVVIRFQSHRDQPGGGLGEGTPTIAPSGDSVTAILDAFRKDTGPSAWRGLPGARSAIAARLQTLITWPEKIDQAHANLCGPAVFMKFWIARDAVGFVRYATEMYNSGRSRIGTLDVHADDDLLEYILPPAPYPHPSDPGKMFHPPVAADWMVMAALRDSTNIFIDYQSVDDEVAGITPPEDVAAWMEATGVYEEVRNEGNWARNATVAHARALRPVTHDVALLIHAKMVTAVSTGPLLDAFPNHYVALAGGVSAGEDRADQRVTFPYWSWGRRDAADVTRTTFDETYFGAVIGVPR